MTRSEHVGDGFGFEATEMRLAMICKNPSDGAVLLRGDQGVDIEKRPAKARREHTAHRGFARAHEAGKDDAARQSCLPRWALAHFVGLEPEFCFSEESEV